MLEELFVSGGKRKSSLVDSYFGWCSNHIHTFTRKLQNWWARGIVHYW